MLRRPSVLLAAAACCTAAAAGVYVLALHVAAAQRVDLRILEGFTGLRGARSATVAGWLVDLFNPAQFAVLIAFVVGIGIARGRPRLGVASGVAMLGANLTTQLLKPALAAPRGGWWATIEPGSWPSGHSTAAMSLALALVLVSPTRLRAAAVAVGVVVAVAMGYAVLLLDSHYPSDVAGGYLVAAAWTCLLAAVALRRPAGARAPAQGPLTAAALAAGALLAGVVVVVVTRPAQVADYAAVHTTFVAGATALAAGAVALTSAVSAVLSGSGPAPTAAPGRRRPR